MYKEIKFKLISKPHMTPISLVKSTESYEVYRLGRDGIEMGGLNYRIGDQVVRAVHGCNSCSSRYCDILTNVIFASQGYLVHFKVDLVHLACEAELPCNSCKI